MLRSRPSPPAAALLLAALLAACGGPQPRGFDTSEAPFVTVPLSEARVIDLRARYRAAVCDRLQGTPQDCEQTLVRLPGEGPAVASPPRADIARRLRVALVPGFMAGCGGPAFDPFTDVAEALRAEGVEVLELGSRGRTPSSVNAAIMAAAIRALPPDPRPIVLLAYSKGLPDSLHLLVEHPEAARQVAAVLAVAGTVGGSPLADLFRAQYRSWVARLPIPGCPTGTGDELEDVRRDVRLAWWAANRDSVRAPIFTLVGMPRPDRVSALLRDNHALLAAIDPRNDGQVIHSDAIPAGGRLLGYVNADHYGIAIALSRSVPILAPLVVDSVPRVELHRAALDLVAESLVAPAPVPRPRGRRRG